MVLAKTVELDVANQDDIVVLLLEDTSQMPGWTLPQPTEQLGVRTGNATGRIG